MAVELQNKLVDNAEAHADIATDSESEGEEHVHGEHCNHGATDSLEHVLNRNEKKARSILAKLGLKPVPGIERVTLKRTRNMIFAINNPEVYKVGDSYIVFGEAKMEDPALQAQAFANQRMAAARSETAQANVTEVTAEEEDDGQEVDASGLDEKDIKIVMEQGNVPRTKAVQALRAAKGDIVNAIMELSL